MLAKAEKVTTRATSQRTCKSKNATLILRLRASNCNVFFLLIKFRPCLCCGCCNCSRVNQTYCCCCYHCVHRVSACRRPDLSRMKAIVPRGKSASSIAPAPPSQPPPPPPVATVEVVKGSLESESESGLESGTDSPVKGLEPRKESVLSAAVSDDCGSWRF